MNNEHTVTAHNEPDKRSPQLDLHELEHKKVEKGTEPTKNPSDDEHKVSDNSSAEPSVDVVHFDEVKRKPPLVKQNIYWLDEVVKIVYKKKVYPDPNVGCSASEQEFTRL